MGCYSVLSGRPKPADEVESAKSDETHRCAKNHDRIVERDDAVKVDVRLLELELVQIDEAHAVTQREDCVRNVDITVKLNVAEHGGLRRSLAAAVDFDIIDVQHEHVGAVEVTERDLHGSAVCIRAEVDGVLLVLDGAEAAPESFAPGRAVIGGNIDLEVIVGIAGILSDKPEGELGSGEFGGDHPVIRVECGAAARAVVVVGFAGRNAFTAVGGVVAAAGVVLPHPVIAVAVLIDELEALSDRIGLEVPDNGVRVMILSGDGGIGCDSFAVIVPAVEDIAVMFGRFGEVSLGENGACGNGEGIDGAAVDAVNDKVPVLPADRGPDGPGDRDRRFIVPAGGISREARSTFSEGRRDDCPLRETL